MRLLSPSILALVLVTFACYTVSTSGSPLDEVLEGDRSPRAKGGANSEILEKINVDKYLKNERAVRQQLKCVLKDNAPCDSVGMCYCGNKLLTLKTCHNNHCLKL